VSRRLWLVRHGRTAYNLEGRAQGHTDVPLDEVGDEQARRLCRYLDGLPAREAVTSDMARARQTLAHLGRGDWTLESTPELRERSFGEWEGMRFDEIRPLLAASPVPPGGESEEEVWERAGRAAAGLHARDRPTVVVAHGMILGMVLARLVGAEVGVSGAFRFENCAVTELEPRLGGGWRMVRLNDTRHLEAADPAFLSG
jgi:broad specificity phosphatase PhoE